MEDIKFTPTKNLGLCLAVASSDGLLKILAADDHLKLREWGSQFSLQVNELGLNCLSWSKNLVKEEECIIAVGCKSIETSPKRILNGMKIYNPSSNTEEVEKLESTNSVAFILFNKSSESKPLERIIVPKIKESKAINDISWALMNGRSYYLLAIASESFLKIYELSIKDGNGGMKEGLREMPTIDVYREIKLSENQFYRVSWNVMGTYLSGSEKKKIKIWRASTRGVWTEIKEIEE